MRGTGFLRQVVIIDLLQPFLAYGGISINRELI